MPMKKILIITTGGTLACASTEEGLIPSLSGREIISSLSEITRDFKVTFLDLFSLDSTNVGQQEWIKIAEKIHEEKDNYAGVVVIHGTDTMAYTASTLSFMMQGIPIPVVFTGSQLSILNPVADATENCRCAIHMAGSGIPGIFLAFNRKVILGVRASKVRTVSFDAFESINYPNIAEINSNGLEINLHVAGKVQRE